MSNILLVGSIVIFWLANIEQAAAALDPAKPPPIHIQHRSENLSARSTIQAAHKLCLTKAQYGVAVDSTPPDWMQMFITVTDEYFQGVKYASYKKTETYKLQDNCHLQVKPIHRADIDNGVQHYRVDLLRGKVTRTPSAVVKQQQAQQSMQDFARTHPDLAAELPTLLGTEQAAQLLATQVVGTDTVLNEKCDYLSAAIAGKTRVCYWSTARVYPGPVHRAIILKAIVPFGNTDNINQAVMFEVDTSLDPAVFVPPDGSP